MRGCLLCGLCVVLMQTGCRCSRHPQITGAACGLHAVRDPWPGLWNARADRRSTARLPKGDSALTDYSRKRDDWATRRKAKKCASRMLRMLQRNTGLAYSSNFKSGFRQAYEDVLMGGSGLTPPIPPETYWGVRQRTIQGEANAQQWFAGYRLGAESARHDASAPLAAVATSMGDVGWDVERIDLGNPLYSDDADEHGDYREPAAPASSKTTAGGLSPFGYVR